MIQPVRKPTYAMIKIGTVLLVKRTDYYGHQIRIERLQEV